MRRHGYHFSPAQMAVLTTCINFSSSPLGSDSSSFRRNERLRLVSYINTDNKDTKGNISSSLCTLRLMWTVYHSRNKIGFEHRHWQVLSMYFEEASDPKFI